MTVTRTTATSRRAFLRSAGAFPAFWSLARTARADDEALFRLVRREFPFHDDRAPMNAANLCPSPRAVADRVSELTRDIDRDCSFQNRGKFNELRETAREAVAAQLGVPGDELALVRNTSEANNIVNAGLALGSGDEVLVWDQNHPTNHVAWEVRAARSGFSVRRVGVPKAPSGEEDLAAPFIEAFTPNTRVLALTHVSNVSGIRLPVRRIADAAHEKGIHVHVDGAQSFGGLSVDVPALGADTFSSSSHKWFCGPKECGVLTVRSALIPEIWPSIIAPGWGDDADPDPTGARKFESMGQRDDACLAAMATTAAFHAEIGPARVEKRMLALARPPQGGDPRTRDPAGDPDGRRPVRRRGHHRGPRRGAPRGLLPDVRGARASRAPLRAVSVSRPTSTTPPGISNAPSPASGPSARSSPPADRPPGAVRKDRRGARPPPGAPRRGFRPQFPAEGGGKIEIRSASP